MILLDTNVLSELMRPTPERQVERWFGAQPDASMFISVITEAELRLGAGLLPNGKRKQAILAQIESMLEEDFRGRILPFDRLAARSFADIAGDRRRKGRPISTADAQIAAISRSRGAALATRNVADFDECGVVVINPWQAA